MPTRGAQQGSQISPSISFSDSTKIRVFSNGKDKVFWNQWWLSSYDDEARCASC